MSVLSRLNACPECGSQNARPVLLWPRYFSESVKVRLGLLPVECRECDTQFWRTRPRVWLILSLCVVLIAMLTLAIPNMLPLGTL
jgi:hypothetical protein